MTADRSVRTLRRKAFLGAIIEQLGEIQNVADKLDEAMLAYLITVARDEALKQLDKQER